jgi:hypothetical protein
VVFRPRKQFVRVDAQIPDPDAWFPRFQEAGMDLPETVDERLRFRIAQADVEQNRQLLRELFEVASAA